MTIDAMIPVTMNIASIELIIFPSRFKLSIFATAEEIEKNTSGTTTMNNKFKNKSPNGLIILAFSPNINPIIDPMIMEDKRISGNLYAFNLLIDNYSSPGKYI